MSKYKDLSEEIKEHRREICRKWYKENVEKRREGRRKHYLKNREELLKKQRIYQEEHREENKAYQKKYYTDNPDKKEERNKKITLNARERKLKNKQFFVELLGGCCVRCGYNKSIYALDFHHKEPKQKEFNLGRKMGKFDIETLKEEVKKCELLCANCHREEEYGIVEEEEKDDQVSWNYCIKKEAI